MKLSTIILTCLALFMLGCESDTVSNPGVNRVTEINISPRNEEGKEGWMKLEIFMELNRVDPVYPIGVPNNLKTEKLRLIINKTVRDEDSYYGKFYYYPSADDDLKEINMEDFLWSPYISFGTIKLQNIEGKNLEDMNQMD